MSNEASKALESVKEMLFADNEAAFREMERQILLFGRVTTTTDADGKIMVHPPLEDDGRLATPAHPRKGEG